jgi:hypothetical protein
MGGRAGVAKVPVHRFELATGEMDVIAGVISRQYVEHKAWFRCPAPSGVDAGIRSAVAGPLEASIVRYRGFRCAPNRLLDSRREGSPGRRRARSEATP